MDLPRVISSIPFILICITGALTSYSDIREKKIRNIHLFMTAFPALALYAVSFFTAGSLWQAPLSSAVTATVAGVFFFSINLWRPGDAKLFVTYAFLMPLTGYEQVFALPCVPLFINTFLIGLICFTPVFLWSVLKHPKTLIQAIFMIKDPKNTLIAFMVMISVSWAIPHLLAMTAWHIQPFTRWIIISTLYFLIFRMASYLEEYPQIVIPCVIIGLGLGLRWSPDFYTLEHLTRTVMTLCAYSLGFQLIHNLIRQTRDNKDRVAFAPFLFAGCLASYTPFLGWMLKILHR